MGSLDDDSARRLKPVISELRKFCLAAAVQRMSATLPALPVTPSSAAQSQPPTPNFTPSNAYSPQRPPPPRSMSRPTLQATHPFEPGQMGVSYDDDGFVKKVSENGPAHPKGIKEGTRIVQV